MSRIQRPHLLGIDDGPFDKRKDRTAPIVAVLMEAHDLVEAVAITRFPVDGPDASDFLADWISGLRFANSLHGVVLAGISIAGLGVVDVELLSRRLGVPVMVVNRQEPTNERLNGALVSAGLSERIALVERAPAAWALGPGLFVAHCGTSRENAIALLRACRGKSLLPEPVRLAHLIAGAVAGGESRGRP